MSHSASSPRSETPIVIVTGGGSGIGLASAEELLRRGSTVVITDIDDGRAVEASQQLTHLGMSLPVRADMSDATDVAHLVELVSNKYGRIDAVINNAGAQQSGPVTDFSEAEWDHLLGLNPKSCFLSAKYAAPVLAQAGGGAIVNISSVAGIRGGPGQSAYAASKGAIIALSRSLAVELAPQSIRVNCLAPGWIDTDFNSPAIENMGGLEAFHTMIESTVPMKRQGNPSEIAKAAAFLALPDSSYMTGQILVVDGGQT